MSEYNSHEASLYTLSTGRPVTSLSAFSSPVNEYQAAFEERSASFLNFYYFGDSGVKRRCLTRGEFWDLSVLAACCLSGYGLSKGDRVVHGFSSNNLYDLVFRLAEVLVGCVPVTINWQADTDERLLYKAKVTNAKLFIYDSDFVSWAEKIKPELSEVIFLKTEEVENYQPYRKLDLAPVTWDDEKIIIFTSGTTGKPKGVILPHRSYLANRLTFEQYFGMATDTGLDLLIANPLHHTNSTAIADWGMRRKGATIHLLQRYSTEYWGILVDVAGHKRDLLIAPMVSRHIDFLEDLSAQLKLPIAEDQLMKALSQTEILIGSAPVGPTTVKRILKFSNRLPHVRFGSTETCLQVMATPRTLSPDELTRAFEAGWVHHHKGVAATGYYIGREHFPFTRVMTVKSVDPDSQAYLEPCRTGEPGYLITQGPNIMSHYVGEPEATRAAFAGGWYTGLKDMAFALKNENDGELDYYWTSRDSEFLIRGGANYAYAQIAEDLSKVLTEDFQLKPDQFRLAVVGLRLGSEHEDSCCVTIELSPEVSDVESQLKSEFVERAKKKVSKGALPEYLRFARIPLNFKGAIVYPELKQEFSDYLHKYRDIMP